MSKVIKITLYSPMELWCKFWNRVFWPRRKECAEWMDFAQARLEHTIICDLLIGQYYNNGILNEATCESLELDIRKVIEDVCKETKEIMCKPID